MNEKDVERICRESGALLTGHFQLRSGMHSDHFFQAALLLQYPDKAEGILITTSFLKSPPSPAEKTSSQCPITTWKTSLRSSKRLANMSLISVLRRFPFRRVTRSVSKVVFMMGVRE